MAAGRVGNDFAAKHTGDFFDTLLMVQHADFADSLFAFAVFAHLPMVFTAGSDLRQGGHGEHLMFFTQSTQGFADHFCHAAADTGIDFIKNQRRDLRVLAGNHLQGKADAGKFATGRDFVQRTGRIAFVGGNLELYLLQTVRCGRRRQQDDVETRAFHGEMLHMSGRFLAQPARRLVAHGGKNMGGFLIFGKVAGNGFYYLLGDVARLHSAVLSYARDFMIDRGFTYVIPPYMIHSDVVTGVMSFPEMDAMMYKIEGEDLYLIGTSEHSMIGRFIDSLHEEEKLPYTLTSFSPCFRKEKGAHGIEERGVYRIHQFEKQEMIVICKPEESMDWYNKLWQNTVDFFRSLDIPVRTLECCSGDLADLKVKSCDVEAWSPRQKKYFEVGSCSNLGDAQARRLRIRVKSADGKKYLAHTLNNTCVAPPRMLIAFLENNLQADGSVRIPEALRPYMGGKSELRA